MAIVCNLWNKISQIQKNVIGNNGLNSEVGGNSLETAISDNILIMLANVVLSCYILLPK
jgi:hypothetical protein